MLRFIYGGYDAVHAHPYEMLRQTGVPDYTLLLVKSPAYFYLNGIRTETEPQTAVLFPPLCYRVAARLSRPERG